MSYVNCNHLGCRSVFDDSIECSVNPGAGDYEAAKA